jgi:curved DNA-binding protein CbpA
MPPRAALEAAAALAADGDVGPAPPEIVREVELVGAEARVAAAARVLAAARANGDAYDILGVEDIPGDDGVVSTPSASTLKKLFWKLSLSVHPDKCAHPDAAGAFDAVKKAHETLCDPVARSKVDAAREERAARAGFDSWLKQEQAKARWRATRGEAAPGDEALLRGAVDENESDSKTGREEWMTKLPEQRRPVAGGEPSGGGGHAKAFARTTFVERDARTIAEWTAAPNEIAETEKRLFLAAQEAKYAAPASTSAEDDALRRSVEQVAGTSRGKTLLEKHQEREARAAKAARDAARAAKKDAREAKKAGKGKGEAGAGDELDDGTGWSYRPWNRETDLEAGRVSSTKALSAGELLEKAGGDLKGRFGRGGTEGGGQ